MQGKPPGILPDVEFFELEFAKSTLLDLSPSPGIFLVDRDLRYLHINEHLATFHAPSLRDPIGKTMREIDPEVASVLEPIVIQVIADQRPVLRLEREISRPNEAGIPTSCYWLISCYPLKAANGRVQGAGTIIQDITESKQKELEQEGRLKFEALLSTLSAAFINVPVSAVDNKIEQGLQTVVEFLGFDRSSVFHFSPDGQKLICTHTYATPGTMHPPPVLDKQVPIWTDMVRLGEMFQVSDMDEMPDSQWREKQYCRKQGGIKSILFIPLKVGGTVLGLISFVSYKAKRTWPDVLIQRLRLLSEIFGNALERKRADQKIQKAFSEIEGLKDRLEAENLYLRDQIELKHSHEKIIGESAAIKKVLLQVEQVAKTDSTVLIQGETGTGKELVAHAIHNLSQRRDRQMIKLNCAALPSSLIESELFGHSKGAFTGAIASHAGRFEAAHESSIFLDEIGELPLELQSKLLRVLQEGQLERLGSTKTIRVNARVIAATNRDLSQAVKAGRFREDLYYRLNVFPISVPPLRERREDISLLAWAMVKEFGEAFGKAIESIPKKNLEALERYPWPGNVRELRNMIERAMILTHGPTLTVNLPESSAPAGLKGVSFREMEKMHILTVLEQTGWRVRGKGGAAELLDLKPSTLESKMKKLGITRRLHSGGA